MSTPRKKFVKQINHQRPPWIYVLAAFLVLFGLLTIKKGGSVLFYDSTAKAEAGNYVPFVLWFNFFAGFFYIAASIGIFISAKWTRRLSVVIAGSSALILASLLVHIFTGGLYETRTLIAMTLRVTIWTFTSFLLTKNKHLLQRSHT